MQAWRKYSKFLACVAGGLRRFKIDRKSDEGEVGT